ncbi:MAG: diaminopimelate epimerase [Actinobacteria bacterium]|nr:diaminopimelate epimerase [Actinomycetota bacterium]MCB9412795.1 diaminopimelate epimerase [Actinomycetota bacterium]
MTTLRFTKGEGTGNDFVLLGDYEGSLTLTGDLVRALCDRRFGIGADGVIRVVRTERAFEAPEVEVAAEPTGPEWFMDYWNADGTVSEMCGNGIRVFGRYLVSRGLVQPGRLTVGTRGGPRVLHVPEEGDIEVDMGPAVWQGYPERTAVSLGDVSFPAVGVGLPNPHAVVLLEDLGALPDELPAPSLSGEDFPAGANVEFVEVLSTSRRHLQMRVYERGSAETLSCGTGACAAAVVAARTSLADDHEPIRVDVPGGTLQVRQTSAGSVHLTGPAELVADGTMTPAWLERYT